MFARVNTFKGSPDEVDAAVANVRKNVIPAAKQIPGFAGMVSLVDRETGKSIGITLWKSEDALRQSEEAASRIRNQAAQTDGSAIVSVERYEVADLVLDGR
jgi:heme-degrading monooxygenase HmoA